MPEQIVGGKASAGPEEVAAELLGMYEEAGLLATLDYSLCYDMMDPAIDTWGDGGSWVP